MNETLGTLYIVSTPIGNMLDITLRALETLKTADIILAEDTRQIKKLLKHYDIHNPNIKSYRDQNHDKVFNSIKSALDAGLNIALVSDAGTPTISDPGFKLVRDLRESGQYNVVSIPGASAVVAGLSIIGFPTDKFIFLGFLPKKEGKRRKILAEYGQHQATLVLYESPFRIYKLLEDILDTLGDRRVAITRELTKVHEEVIIDTVSSILSNHKVKEKGEFTVFVRSND